MRHYATSVLLLLIIVLCAWAYPRLNGVVYRRRIARDEADLRAAGASGDQFAPSDPH